MEKLQIQPYENSNSDNEIILLKEDTRAFIKKYICGEELYFKKMARHESLASLVFRTLNKTEIELILDDAIAETKAIFEIDSNSRANRLEYNTRAIVNEFGDVISEDGIGEIARLKAFEIILEVVRIKNRSSTFIDDDFHSYLINVKKVHHTFFERFRYLKALEPIIAKLNFRTEEKNSETFAIIELAPIEMLNPVVKRVVEILECELKVKVVLLPYTPKVIFKNGEDFSNTSGFIDLED